MAFGQDLVRVVEGSRQAQGCVKTQCVRACVCWKSRKDVGGGVTGEKGRVCETDGFYFTIFKFLTWQYHLLLDPAVLIYDLYF